MTRYPTVYEEEDGWYYDDVDGFAHGPFKTEAEAHAAYSRYIFSMGSCPSCQGD
jgi:hypothetical protein